MGFIKRKLSKAVSRRKQRAETGSEKSAEAHHRILTAEGWKRLMLGRGRKDSKVKN